MLLDIAVAEAAKTLAATLTSGAVARAGRLLGLLRRRNAQLPADPTALAELILHYAAEDPGFAAELFDSLAALGAGGAGAISPYPPDPFADRDELRARIAASTGVWVIAGQLGAGKTAFVRRIAHDVADRFPGGQVYVDTDDWRDGETLRTAEIERYVLGQLGAAEIEAAEPALHQQYLSSLLRRRFVLILENVAGVDEARPLAQPWPCSLVLVTTRRLTGDMRIWSTPDRLVPMHGLDEAGAWDLLASRCGPAMLAAEPAAAGRLLDICDRMPFAILQLGSILDRRRGEPGAVAMVQAEFETGDDVIRRCLADTLAQLSSSTLESLTVLARHPGENFTYRSAAAMLGHPAGRSLDELIDACLVENAGGRLRLHRLVRQYAGARQVDDGPYFDRLLAFYRDWAVAADLSTGERLRRYPIPAGLEWPALDPIDWLDAESATIVELVKQAHLRGRHVEVVQLCGPLEVLLNHRGYHWRCAEAFDWGIRSAASLDDRATLARLHAMLGRVFTLLHLFDRAASALDTAYRLLADLDDARLESSIMEFRGRFHEERSEYDTAISYLRQAVSLDLSAGLSRPLRLHRRMLANLLVKADQPAEALPLLDGAGTGEERNDARVQMVLAKAYTALGDLDRARSALTQARTLASRSGATQYDLELADIEASLAFRAGDVEAARSLWGWVADRYGDWGHPRFNEYLEKLDRLPPPPR
jgi:tetratricopeptide (TPR) repeat protein